MKNQNSSIPETESRIKQGISSPTELVKSGAGETLSMMDIEQTVDSRQPISFKTRFLDKGFEVRDIFMAMELLRPPVALRRESFGDRPGQ